MGYMIIGAVLATLEAYWWLRAPNAAAFSMPLAFRLFIPFLVALAVFRRPKTEVPVIIVLAATLAISLARDVLGQTPMLRLAVLAGASFLMWSGHKLRERRDSLSSRRLLAAAALVVIGFLLFWLVPLL